MILLRLLEVDFYGSKQSGDRKTPLILEVPILKAHLPAIVSNSVGKFLVSRKASKNSTIRVGVFSYDNARLDDIIGDLFSSALELSTEEKFGNIFDTPEKAFEYIKTLSDKEHPKNVLIPKEWSDRKISTFFGKKNVSASKDLKLCEFMYNSNCSIVRSNVKTPVFLSKPDFVGLHTQFMGDFSAILLHNVKLGISFCKI